MKSMEVGSLYVPLDNSSTKFSSGKWIKFGKVDSNFSPSFDEISRNVKFFTHEWYYLQSVPSYYSILPISNLDNVYSYFPDKIDVTATGLLDVYGDYFTEYFTVDYLIKPGILNNISPLQPYLINIGLYILILLLYTEVK